MHFQEQICFFLVLATESPIELFLALKMLQYSQILEFLKTAARSIFGRDIPWKISDFFQNKKWLIEKCILSQIELIRP